MDLRFFRLFVVRFFLLAFWLGSAFADPPSTHVTYRDSSEKVFGTYINEQTFIDRSYHGYYSESRQKVLDSIIASDLVGKASQLKPEIIFFAGGSGSGKSSLLSQIQKYTGINTNEFVVVDPDRIKGRLPEFLQMRESNPELAARVVHRESNYASEILLEAALRRGRHIIFDTTLANAEYFIGLVTRIKMMFPEYKLTLMHIEAPVSEIGVRLKARSEVEKRAVQINLALEKTNLARSVVWNLNSYFDRFFKFRNDTKLHLVFARIFDKYITHAPSVTAAEFNLKTQIPKIKPIDIVFDLDWTLIYDAFDYVGPYVTASKGRNYRISDFAGEILYALSLIPGARISFFSGNDAVRNEDVLKSINLPDGRTAYDIAFQILSAEDLTLKKDASGTFSQRFMKDLNKVDKNIDLNRTVIVEDIKKFVPHQQLRNVLWLGKTYNYYNTYSEVPEKSGEYIPENYMQWNLERNKLLWVLGILSMGLAESQRNGKNLVDVLEELQKDNLGNFVDRTDSSQFKYYSLGQSILKRLVPHRKTVNSVPLKCSAIL